MLSLSRMRGVLLLASVTPLLFSSATAQQQFNLRDKFVGHDFLSAFQWETLDDPTHGRVNYVDQGTALQKNLTYASDSSFVMRVDSQNVVQPGQRGRDSNRIKSNNAYTDSVMIINVRHMPEGCGTWPAFWTISRQGPWPNGGEIDIIEGVNTQAQNLASLHTTDGCTQPQSRDQKGTTISTDCNAAHNDNAGCGTQFSGPSSYGASFNDGGGGWFCAVRTVQKGLAIFFWSRNDPSVPDAVRNDGAGVAQTVSPDASWGTPQARFVPDTCEWGSHFDAHQMIFDTTLCGDWAGATFSQNGCGGDCKAYVDNNPEAFRNAYWEIDSLRVYTP